ncbi:hypothetical protein [Sphingobacterium haloxyli]|nr:hypothetical protein [Sphingobacterium haloxyli]
MNDIKLWKQFQQGDAEAFDILVKQAWIRKRRPPVVPLLPTRCQDG